MSEKILVIVPTFNEVENLPKIVPAILNAVPRANVLVVDDLSPDGTGAVAEGLRAKDPRVFVEHRDGPRGLGRAYIHGFKWALNRGYDLIFEMDADFSHQPKYLSRFLEKIKDADLVLGCRYMPGGGIEGWGAHRLLISRGGNVYARLALNLPYRDLTGGFKCFRRSALEAIDLDAVRSTGYCFQIELTYRVHCAGMRISELPIVFPDRTMGKSKMSGAIFHEAFMQVMALRFKRP